jgi:hypothetical protein
MVLGSVAAAKPAPAPLVTFPASDIDQLEPLLHGRDLALIESNDKGELKQLTTVTLVAAAPEQVREVVVHPEKYTDFVRNMKECTVKKEPEGTLWNQYQVSYGIYTVDGRHRYVLLPKGADDAAAPVWMYDPDENGVRNYRWEFRNAPGGGTLLVLYGYTQIPRDNLMAKFLNAAKTLEHGLALITQQTLMLSMKARAEEIAHHPVLPAPTAQGSYSALLKRGTVALFRSQGGRLSELSLIDRTSARPEVVAKVASDPTAWSQFVPTVAKSTHLDGKGGVPGVELQQSLPLLEWTTGFAYRSAGDAADQVGLSGDLRGAHLRWDVRRLSENRTELVLRAVARYDAGSMVVRQLYKLEPFFEYGINLGMSLVLLEGVRTHAEELTRQHAQK